MRVNLRATRLSRMGRSSEIRERISRGSTESIAPGASLASARSHASTAWYVCGSPFDHHLHSHLLAAATPNRIPNRPGRERDPDGIGNGNGAVEQGKGIVTIPTEFRQLRWVDRRSVGEVDREGIAMPSVQQKLVMKMRAGGEAGRADSADDLTLVHVRAGPDVGRNGAEMRVACPDLSGVAKLDKSAVRAHESRPRDDP